MAAPTSASARFRRKSKKKKDDDDYLYINAWKKELLVRNGTTTRTTFDTDFELIAAYAEACEEAEREGWTEYGEDDTWRDRIDDTPKKKKPNAAEAEKRFEEMSATLAKALTAAAGKRSDERKAIAAALASYAELKTALGGDRYENALHFFAVDGVGLKKTRKPAFDRPKADPATHQRWLALLTEVAR